MRYLIFSALLCILLTVTGCVPIEIAARDSIAAFKGYEDTAIRLHGPECLQAHGQLPVCQTIVKAAYAENAAVTALETYCQLSPTDDPAKKCQPVKGAYSGLQAALLNLSQLSSEIKGAAQ